MIPLLFDYATPSALSSDRERAQLGLAADARRPVRFHGRVTRDALSLRLALQALGELVWSDDSWHSREGYLATVLDPAITVHDDRVFFEAFSQDQSAYGLVVVPRSLFATEGPVACGTTNVDFSAWLWGALGEMRSSRETWLRVEAAGFEVLTAGSGGRYERKVDLPEEWVRGFLQLQGAMAMPGTRLSMRPVDLLAALRYLRYTKAKVSPRALRYEMEPGSDARLVLEPWEEVVPLKGAGHAYTEKRVIRTWGRRRLRLIEGLLPYAEVVRVYLKGRALPSFYAVEVGGAGITFLLGLSGWTENRWTGTGSFDLLTADTSGDAALLPRALDELRRAQALSPLRLAESLSTDRETAERLLARLCRRGQAIYDVEERRFRHRELFATPIDEERLYPEDPRAPQARRLLAEGRASVQSVEARETRKTKKLKTPDGERLREIVYRDWRVSGTVGGEPTEIVVGDGGRILFGTCGCDFFEENLLNKGPCAHMLVLHAVSGDARKDLPTSVQATAAPPSPQAESLRHAADAENDGNDEKNDDE